MLIVLVQNDGTGTNKNANYKYTIKINEKIIETGTIKGHNREHGWQSLIIKLAEESMDRELMDAIANDKYG